MKLKLTKRTVDGLEPREGRYTVWDESLAQAEEALTMADLAVIAREMARVVIELAETFVGKPDRGEFVRVVQARFDTILGAGGVRPTEPLCRSESTPSIAPGICS